MTVLSPVASKAAELRDAFDRERTLPFASQVGEQTESLLAIRVSGDAYAIKVSEISGLANDRKIVAFPSPIPELLGVACIRGGLVPAYNLAALLGYSVEGDQARWLLLCGIEEPVGLAVSDFDGYIRVPSAQVYAVGQKEAARACVSHVIRAADMVRAVVSIPLLRDVIQRRCGNRSASKER